MDERLIKKINRYFHDEEARFFSARHQARMGREKAFYKEFFKTKRPGLKILDIGSGTGLVASARPKDVRRFVLTDISGEMLKSARGNLGEDKNLEYIVCDAEKMPFKDGAFDIVTCNAAAHHFPSIEKFSREMTRVLKAGGTAVLSFESNRRFWRNRILVFLYRVFAKLGWSGGESGVPYDKVRESVNSRLLSEGAIDAPLSRDEMMAGVDLHSPTAASRIDSSKGFDVSEMLSGAFKGYETRVVYHYASVPLLVGLIARLLCPSCAPKFSLILKKATGAKINILYLFVHLGYGGAEVGLLTTLKSLDRSRFDATVVSIEKRGSIGEEIERLGFRVICLGAKARLYNIPLVFRMTKILKCIGPDILHTSLFYANFFGRLAALFARPGAIVTEERSTYTEKRFYHILFDRLFAGMTDRIIVCSKSVLDFTAKQEGINEQKFYLIYNAVDQERFDIKEDREDLRAGYNLSGDDFVIGTAGSLIPKKGHAFLIEAVAKITSQIPHIRLLVIGGGPLRTGLEKMAALYGISDNVKFLGSRMDMAGLMKAMDVFVLPSLQEGFPRALIEAMYTGLPVIASNISGIPEVVSDGVNGFLTPAGDAGAIAERLSSLHKDARLRKRLGASARKTIEAGYLPKDHAERLEKLYLELMERKG